MRYQDVWVVVVVVVVWEWRITKNSKIQNSKHVCNADACSRLLFFLLSFFFVGRVQKDDERGVFDVFAFFENFVLFVWEFDDDDDDDDASSS